MGALEILYEELTRIRDNISDKIEQEKSSKALVKDALYGFYQEYEFYNQRANLPIDAEIEEMIEGYHTLFKNISIKLRDFLPEELLKRIKHLILEIDNVLTSIRSVETKLLDLVTVCANEALDIYKNFDNYFT